MGYHIDTGLIKEKFNVDCECPLCEIKKIVEEQFLHEFLNDAVMEENTRITVGKRGFCSRHFDMLFTRKNKLSVALQIDTRAEVLSSFIGEINNAKQAKKLADQIDEASRSCVICALTEESMVKYYKTIAQMFEKEKDFFRTIIASKGFCLHHYAELLRYSSYAGFMKNEYVSVLSSTQNRNFTRLRTELKSFCDKHDYRRANEPLGSAETALPRMRVKLYGEKTE
ncbi:MAG: hypothetical protein E7382_01080 [Clostridiales bacterium]|nr:hypothetical protein [Clostridiales bacterium]